MRSISPRGIVWRLHLVALLPLASACGGDQAAETEPPQAEAPVVPPESPEVTALRDKFAPFQDFAAAEAAGYGTRITPCWFHRDNGGQGIHYGKNDLIDGTVSPMDPELVMYEPQADSTLALVGVEYIVPFDQWTATDAPMALGQMFHRNEALSLWVLHVWLWRDNPSGMYADWNPAVSCDNAAEKEDRADV